MNVSLSLSDCSRNISVQTLGADDNGKLLLYSLVITPHNLSGFPDRLESDRN